MNSVKNKMRNELNIGENVQEKSKNLKKKASPLFYPS